MSHAPGARFLLLRDPGLGADFGASEKRAIAALHFHRVGAGQEELAGKVGAETAVLQPSLNDTALKDAALSIHSQTQLVGAPPAGSGLLRLKGFTGAAV